MLRPIFTHLFAACAASLFLAGASVAQTADETGRVEIFVSVADQYLAVMRAGELLGKFPVSTSKFGLGDSWGSYQTPVGMLRVCDKIGGHLPHGAVLRGRHATGEVLAPNAPGRDPIVTRILWLEGLEASNEHARARGIYIHGTPEERNIGRPASYGCIRMRSKDVAKLYELASIGSIVKIETRKLTPIVREQTALRETRLAMLKKAEKTGGIAAASPMPKIAPAETAVPPPPALALGPPVKTKHPHSLLQSSILDIATYDATDTIGLRGAEAIAAESNGHGRGKLASRSAR